MKYVTALFAHLCYGFIVMFMASSVFAGPGYTTYQAKIIKPDGLPLEANVVNFKFTILNPAGSCILYSETYSSVNMASTGGVISFSLGSGVKTYPVSATTFENVFSNITPALACDVSGPPTYAPSANDIRKIVMQFHDGNGWQTLPAMSINAVPYAMYANDSQKLNGKTDADFVQVSTLPMTCGASEALRFNGAAFSCIAVGGAGGGSVTSGSVITALGYTPANGASVTTLTSNVSVVSSTVSSLSSTVSGISTTVSGLSASLAAIVSSKWSASGTSIFYNTGNIGIGTSTPVTRLDVAGGIRIGTEAAVCAAAYAGTLRYNSGVVEYCNGTSWSAFGVSGAGILAMNGLTSGSQTFAFGSSGNFPNVSSVGSVHTFNFPFASVGTTTAGVISNTDYLNFTNKITSSAASIAQVLGYIPGASGAVPTGVLLAVNNLSDLNSVATARTNLGLGGFATVSSLDLGSASATGTLAEARLPSFANVTSGAQYTKVTVDGKGRVTSGAQLSTADVTTALGYAPVSASSASQWTTSGSIIYYAAGSVGIGTSAPTQSLEVTGNIKINNLAGANSILFSAPGTNNYPGVVWNDATTGAGSFIAHNTIDNGTSYGQSWLFNAYQSGNAASTNLKRIRSSYSPARLTINGHDAGLNYLTGTAGAVDSSITDMTSRFYIQNNTGNVGVGTTTPITKLDVSGGLRISMEAVTCAASYAGTIRYNSGNVEYCNGTSWSAFGVAGAGIIGLNGSSSGTQSFANGFTGTQPAYVTLNGVHTLNIPYASAGSVTAGLISNTDYLNFTNKITSSAASIAQVLGYVPASATALGNFLVKANNLSDLNSVATARTNLGLGGFATVSSLDLGSASATGTLAEARLPSFANVTSGAQYTKVTVDGKGRVTSGAQLSTADVTTALGYTPVSASSASQWTTSGSIIYYTAGSVGIGSSNPEAQLHVVSSSNDSHFLVDNYADSTAGGGIVGRHARGTSSAPAALMNNDDLLFLGGRGYDGSGFSANSKASIRMSTSENWTSVSQGARIKFYTTSNGTSGSLERVRFDENGNVGIGTTLPTARLHIAAGTSMLAPLKFNSGTLLTSPQSGTMEYDGVEFYLTDSAGVRRAIATGSNASTIDDASFINSAGNITMTPVGSVIVSSTTASTNSQTGALVVKGGLGVAGNIYSSGTIITTSNIQGSVITATSATITPYVYGSTASGGSLSLESTTHSSKGNILLAQNGGRVGIGTSAPAVVLHVRNDQDAITAAVVENDSTASSAASRWTATSDVSSISIQANSSAFSDAPGVYGGPSGVGLWTSSSASGGLAISARAVSGTVRVYTGGNNERMRIDSNGNVGIGTNNPDRKLHISRGAGTNSIRFDGFAAGTSFTPVIGTGSDFGSLIEGADSGQIVMALKDNDGNDGFRILSGGGNFITDGLYDTPVFAALSSGNVGIGTSAPTHPLEVSQNSATPAFAITRSGYTAAAFSVSNNGTHDILGIGSDASKFAITLNQTNGNVGIGTSAPSAKLHLAAGSTSNAPLKFSSGTLLTTPASGAIEYNGFDLYFTDGAGVRRALTTGSNPNTVDDASFINATGNITMTPVGSVVVSSTTASTNSSTGALVVKGGVGISGNTNMAGSLNVSGVLNVSNTFSANSLIYLSATGSTYSDAAAAYAGGERGISIDTGVNTAWQIAKFKNASSTVMSILGNGKVGIGTTTPTAELQVDGEITAVRGGGTISLKAGPTLDHTYLQFFARTAASGTRSAYIGYGSNGTNHLNVVNEISTGSLNLGSSGAIHMTVAASGAVGIGTSTPQAKLDILGGGFLLTDADVGHGVTGWDPTNAYGSLKADSAVDGGLKVTGLSDGVGTSGLNLNGLIGIADPTDSVPAIVMNGAKKAGTGQNALGLLETVFQIQNASSAKFTILGSGNTGIGTTVPNSPLHVAFASNATSIGSANSLKIQNTDATVNNMSGLVFNEGTASAQAGAAIVTQFEEHDTTPNSNLSFYTQGGTLSERMRISSAGLVAIGTTNPIDKLHVYDGSIRMGSSTDTNASQGILKFGSVTYPTAFAGVEGVAKGSPDRMELAFKTAYGSAVEAMRISEYGDVGIGTTTPAYPIDIHTANAFTARYVHASNNQYNGPAIMMVRARNTTASHTAVQAGDTIGGMYFRAFDGVNANNTNASIEVSAYGAQTPSNRANYMIFETTLASSTVRAERMRISSAGYIGIGTNAPNTLLQIGPSGSAATANLSFVGSYLSTSGQAQYAGNWASTGYWGVGPATNSTDNNIRIGNIATASGTWSGTQNLNLLLGGNLGIGQTNPINPLDVLKVSGDLTARFKADSVDSDVSILMQNDVQTWKIQNRAGYSDAFVIEDTTASKNPFVMKKSTGFLGLGNVTNPGYQLEVSGTVQITSGSALRIGAANICTSAGCTSSSDLRLKQNIQPLDFSLEKLLSLKGVQYDWKDKAVYGDKHQIGFIAQELEKVFPEVVYTDKETGLKTVSYGQLIAPLVEAFKKLFEKTQNNTRAIASLEEKDNVKDQQIKALTLENARKDQELREMKERLDRIEKALNKK